jgi:hypothetical protein
VATEGQISTCSNLFISNLFTASGAGVIFVEFIKSRHEAQGFLILSAEQQAWAQCVWYVMALRYNRVIPRPSQYLRKLCYSVATSPLFERFIMCIVVVNIVEMCVWWYGMPDLWNTYKERINVGVYICFLVRCGDFMACAAFIHTWHWVVIYKFLKFRHARPAIVHCCFGALAKMWMHGP